MSFDDWLNHPDEFEILTEHVQTIRCHSIFASDKGYPVNAMCEMSEKCQYCRWTGACAFLGDHEGCRSTNGTSGGWKCGCPCHELLNQYM